MAEVRFRETLKVSPPCATAVGTVGIPPGSAPAGASSLVCGPPRSLELYQTRNRSARGCQGRMPCKPAALRSSVEKPGSRPSPLSYAPLVRPSRPLHELTGQPSCARRVVGREQAQSHLQITDEKARAGLAHRVHLVLDRCDDRLEGLDGDRFGEALRNTGGPARASLPLRSCCR